MPDKNIPCMLCPTPQFVFLTGDEAIQHWDILDFSFRQRESFCSPYFLSSKKKTRKKKKQVLRPPPPARDQLPQEEVRPHQPAPPQEEAEVERESDGMMMEKKRKKKKRESLKKIRGGRSNSTLSLSLSFLSYSTFLPFLVPFCRFLSACLFLPTVCKRTRERESGT